MADERSKEARYFSRDKARDCRLECIVKDNVVVGRESDGEAANFGRTILGCFDGKPDFVGMIDAVSGDETTFADMKDRSVRCALWLRKQGITESDVVAVSTPIRTSDYVPYLATLYLNAIVSPWHHDASAENAQRYLETCRPRVVFACRRSIDKLATIASELAFDCKFVTFDEHRQHASLDEITAEQSQGEVEDFACAVPLEPSKKVSRIVFSSGSSGPPKAVALPYHGMLARGLPRSGMRCLWYSPLAWISCGILTLSAVERRCTRVVHSQFDAEASGAIVERYKIDYLFLRPYLLTLCLRANIFTRYDFSTLESIEFAGTKIHKTTLEECRGSLPFTFVSNVYGLTETGGRIANQTKNSQSLDSAGFACSGVRLKIVEPNTGLVLGPNQRGEIYAKVDYAMLGYFNNPLETSKVMDAEGWLRCGDLGFYDENGELFIGDRMKAMIKTRFYTLSAVDFEETLMQHPHVVDCAVVSVEHSLDVERPFVFIVKAPDAETTAENLIEFAANKNQRYRLIAGLAFVDELPYTPSGKKHLVKLQAMAGTYPHQ